MSAPRWVAWCYGLELRSGRAVGCHRAGLGVEYAQGPYLDTGYLIVTVEAAQSDAKRAAL